MNVLTIRSHTRFALRQPVKLICADSRPAKGLMIELSADGCRISGLGHERFAVNQSVEVALMKDTSLTAHVRWAKDGTVGLRIEKPLTNAQLAEILGKSRGRVEVRRYGT